MPGPLVVAIGMVAATGALSVAMLAVLYVLLFIALYRVAPVVGIAVGLTHAHAEIGSLLIVAAVGTAVVGQVDKPRIQGVYAATVALAAAKHNGIAAAAAGLLAVMHLAGPLIQSRLPPPKPH